MLSQWRTPVRAGETPVGVHRFGGGWGRVVGGWQQVGMAAVAAHATSYSTSRPDLLTFVSQTCAIHMAHAVLSRAVAQAGARGKCPPTLRGLPYNSTTGCRAPVLAPLHQLAGMYAGLAACSKSTTTVNRLIVTAIASWVNELERKHKLVP